MAATTTVTMLGSPFSLLSDDIVLNIFHKLESEPRDWARLACVSARFSGLIRDTCCKASCNRSIPAVVSDLISASDSQGQPPGGWAAFYKLSVCCPGLLCAGVLLENSDFGLEREIGPDENYRNGGMVIVQQTSSSTSSGSLESVATATPPTPTATPPPCYSAAADCNWSLFDDLYYDTVYDVSESHAAAAMAVDRAEPADAVSVGWEFSKKRMKQCSAKVGCHLASAGVWNPSREQGNKLLASRFRGDCLYICDWPGCVHAEEKRKYMLFRGVFKNFKRSRVWRAISDGNRNKIDLDCAFCRCRETWDLHSAFCLRRVFGYHDDGEPVVRAYVCENGHVSGAWTERPLYA